MTTGKQITEKEAERRFQEYEETRIRRFQEYEKPRIKEKIAKFGGLEGTWKGNGVVGYKQGIGQGHISEEWIVEFKMIEGLGTPFCNMCIPGPKQDGTYYIFPELLKGKTLENAYSFAYKIEC